MLIFKERSCKGFKNLEQNRSLQEGYTNGIFSCTYLIMNHYITFFSILVL